MTGSIVRALNEYVEQQLENPEFAAAWREGEGEYQVMRALVLARAETGLSRGSSPTERSCPRRPSAS